MWNKPTNLVVSAVILFGATAVPADDFTLDWWTIDGGGDMFSTGGDFELSGTIGQPDANAVVMIGGDFELAGGFWAGVPAAVSAPGDSDGDGDVDLDDYAGFDPCLAGPGGGLGAGCDRFDFDGSGDIDLEDFADFQAVFTGSLP
ncbi:MAG: hypothetical protein ACYTFA_11305 [Planctomycetota bacterium]|jgi:hypothetical protein